MTSQWPVYKEEWNFKENEAEIDAIKEAVRNIRNIRAEMNVAPSKKVACLRCFRKRRCSVYL